MLWESILRHIALLTSPDTAETRRNTQRGKRSKVKQAKHEVEAGAAWFITEAPPLHILPPNPFNSRLYLSSLIPLHIHSLSPFRSPPFPTQLDMKWNTRKEEVRTESPPTKHTHAEKLKEAVTEREVNMISFLLFWALWFHMSTDSTWRLADDQIKSRLNTH